MVTMTIPLTPSAPGELKLTGDVRIGNTLTLNYLDPVTGVLWVMSDLDGWWNLPNIVTNDDPKPPPQDGSWDEDGQYGARLVTLKGAFSAPDIASFQRARRQLLEAVNLVRVAGVLQVDEDTPMQAGVRLYGTPTIDANRLSRLCYFTIPLKCPDPLKYSIATLAGSTQLGTPSTGRTYPLTFNRVYGASGNPGQVVVNNIGDAPSGGLITFYGPVASPSVESAEAAAHITINTPIVVGDVLVLDLYNQWITLNGTADLRGAMSADSNWFKIIPGINTLRFTGTQQIPPPPNAMMSVLARSAWYV